MKLIATSICLICLAWQFSSCSFESKSERKTVEVIEFDSEPNVQQSKLSKQKLTFSKQLSLQGIQYQIMASGDGSVQQLTIIPSGLSIVNDTIRQESDPVIGAEIEDLDMDGFPELLVYTSSAGSGSYGQVIGYSPNQGKSLSQIFFPSLEKGKKESMGYQGHDQFSIVEASLSRRFPIFEKDDPNAKPSGKIRQLQYKLKRGEASKKFVLIGSMEFESPK